MISIENKFLFIHIPKTGGNSIQNILRKYSEDKIVSVSSIQDGLERFEVRNDKYDIVKHSTLSQYKKLIEPSIYKNLFKFSTIRNPWDMMVSFYFSPHRGIINWNRDEFKLLIESTSTVRDYVTIESIPEKINRKVGLFKIPFKKKALDYEIDFFMKFENLDNDFKKVCEILEISYNQLPHRNKSERKHYSNYYDEELIELVNKKFIEEIKLGEYTFEYS